METASQAIENVDIQRAQEALQDGMALAKSRCKLILMADKSDFGWSTVSEYVADELAENSEDDKKIQKAERLAERKVAKKRKLKERKRPTMTASGTPAIHLPYKQFLRPFASTNYVQRSQIGPCFKKSIGSVLYTWDNMSN